jgi:hypothetical protein
MATEAATAWASGGSLGNYTCNTGGYLLIGNKSGGKCTTWCYTGTCAGYAHASNNNTCNCPSTSDTQWQ